MTSRLHVLALAAAVALVAPVTLNADGASLNEAWAGKTARTWHAENSARINAPMEYIHPYLSDLNTWPEWTAWTAERDPDAEWTFEGEAGQVGHLMTWDGPRLKKGRVQISLSDPAVGVHYDMWFNQTKAEGSPGKGTVLMTADGDATQVQWTDKGELGWLAYTFFRKGIEQALASDFEIALAKLKIAAEKDYAQAKAEDAARFAEMKARKEALAAEEKAAKEKAAAEEAAAAAESEADPNESEGLPKKK